MPFDPNYQGADIPLYVTEADDVDCGEIEDRNFLSVGSDPHGLDRDGDGIACEQDSGDGTTDPLPRRRDFNGDDKTDLLIFNPAGGWSGIWLMDGPNITSSTSLWTGWKPVAGADFNGDLQTDIVIQNVDNDWFGIYPC